MNRLDTFYKHYITALYFTDTGEDEQPEREDPMHPSAIEQARRDCARFLELADLFEFDLNCPNGIEGQAAHDFWLTRNGHGAGFWDGDWPEQLGEDLSELARWFGSVDVYLGDDCFIHLFGGKTP